MKLNRRELIQSAGIGLGTMALFQGSTQAAAEEYSKPSKIKLGLVTYNLAKDWDIETIIKNCEKTKYQGVELRTTHAHKVELYLSKEDREKVKKQFQDSKVELVCLGSIYDFHTPDQAKLRTDIAAAKEYILLAKDTGAKAIKVRPNGFPEGVPKEKTLEQIGKSLGELAAYGADQGIKVWVEVHGSQTCQLPNMKVMLDTANNANLGAVWNCNREDLSGDGFEANFKLIENKITHVHLKELSDETYPYRKLYENLSRIGFTGYTCAEIDSSNDPIRLMQYYRALFLTYQGLL